MTRAKRLAGPDRNLSPERAVAAPASSSAALTESWLSGGAAVLESSGRILTANDELATWLGYTPARLSGHFFPKLMGRYRAEWEDTLQRFISDANGFDRLDLSTGEGGLDRLSVELACHGQTLFLRLESSLPPTSELQDLFPETSWGRAMSHHAFHRMLRSETQIANLMHGWPGIIFSQRPDFSFVFVSPRIEELTGVPASEWRRHSKYFWDVVHEADAESLNARLRSEAQNPAGTTSTFRIRHLRTGRLTYLWEHRRAVRTGNGLLLGFEGIWLDITRQSIAERRLLSMSWRENLGTLTMGLAHDFSNILSGIVGMAESFEAGLEPDTPLRAGLGRIRSTAMQASQVTHRIRQLHQGPPGEKRFQDLNETVAGLVEVLLTVLPRRVRLQTMLQPGQLPLYADAVELQQVIVNLALNAADAMPEGGELTFRTARHEQMPAVHHLQGLPPRAPLVSLSVQDTGTGIPARFVASIFEPFFTTKPLGKGSGLGLYNARLFAEKHGAAISVETKEGSGTAFHLWFAQADFTEGDLPPAPERRARHTLLVAILNGRDGFHPVPPPGDRDGFHPAPLLPSARLDQTVELLRQHGYYVVPATSEADVVEAVHAPHFQLTGLIVLCATSGPDELRLCQRIRAYRLPLKTVLSVFGSHQESLSASLLGTVDAVIPHHLPAPDFVARLNAVLDAGSTAD
jgi:PAS domain S-box-containing protein